MIWLTWRQFRAQAASALIVLAAAAIYFLITGLRMRHSYTADLVSCRSQNDCGDVLSRFQGTYNAAFQLAEILVIAAPALIGIFWGAPLIGRELETGTHQFAWNQSVTRTRWLGTKLVGVGVVSIVAAGLLSYLMTWWAGPLDQVNGNRFGAMTFSTRDIVPLGYAAFAFALGTTAGLLIRRTIPAMAVTLAVFIGVQILVPTTIRPNLLPSTTVTYAMNQSTLSQANGIYGAGGPDDGFYMDGLSIPEGSWVLSTSPVETSSGQVVPMNAVQACLPTPDRAAGVNPFEQFGACVAKENLHETISYKPAKDYWPVQWYETATFFALAALLAGFCFWWIRR
ncbi:MAG TPA: ABC transporter permease subunit, partial [Actinospica sp.]|nr:ABC transporter permease subunit [Actinospica sp.]